MTTQPTLESPRDRATIRAGGIALVAGAVAFMAVFAWLAAKFNYPDVLDGSAGAVLPALLATGTAGRGAWAFYAFLPLIWIPAGVGAFHALRHAGEGAMRNAMHFATLAAFAMMLGLMRWPSIHWELAQAWVASDPAQRGALEPIFLGLNRYLGNYIGEFLGELSMSLFFGLSGRVMVREGSGVPRWTGYLALVTAAAGVVGMFRNVTDRVTGRPRSNVHQFFYVPGLDFMVGFKKDGAGDPVAILSSNFRRRLVEVHLY
ncbi:MAG: DUF4386 domain-containing protein [Thermoanaerobaculia bacterium]